MANGKKETSVNYDFMRVLMSLLVIGFHTPKPDYLDDKRLLYNSLTAFLLQCNGVFFMISGRFNLCKKFEYKKEYISYYTNRFISIVIPYGIGTCLLVLLDVILSEQPCNLNGYIYQCIEAFFSTNANGHLWFICTLIGFLISAPFLAKMVTSMKDEELKVLFGVGIAWNVIAIYLTGDLGLTFGISGWFLWGWIFLFFLGYFCERIVNDKNIKIIYCLGILGYAFSVFGMTYLKTFQYANDLSVGYIFFTMGCYLFLKRNIVMNHGIAACVLAPIIRYMAKYSFVAYILHASIIGNITMKHIDPNEGFVQYMAAIVITFIISYIASIIVTNILIKPIQRLSSKILGRFV